MHFSLICRALRLDFLLPLMTLTVPLTQGERRSQSDKLKMTFGSMPISVLTHDVCGPGSIGVFTTEFRQSAKVWDPTQRLS